MKNALAAYFVGLLFALGLGLSGMTQTQNVVAFLDIFGQWNPSLMFVMVGAIAVHSISYRWIRSASSPLLSSDWHVPQKRELTPALLVGAAIFGLGWGLGGFCPGPAVTSLASFDLRPALFVVFMLLGMVLFRVLDQKFHFNR